MRFAVTLSLISCIHAYVLSANRRGPNPSANPYYASPAPSIPELEPTQLSLSPSPGSAELDPYPNKPRITFNEDGSFKLTVFSDVHFGENPWDSWGPEQDINTTALMKKLLKIEMPDYV